MRCLIVVWLFFFAVNQAWAQDTGAAPAATGAAASAAPAGAQSAGQQSAIPAITNTARGLQMATEPGLPAAAPASIANVARSAPVERNEFQDFVAQSLGRDLPLFGASLFQDTPSTFAPLDRVPVTPDYLIGPGDEILISGWGQVDIDYKVTVDRNGSISIPRVGNISVAGLRYQDLEGQIRRAVGRVFTNFDLRATLGQLRSIQVFVVGNAKRPGAYTVSSLSTLVNALFASGGPSTKGSMRAIQVKRSDRVVIEFDLYDLLLKGDKSKDVRLLPGDVIFIPPVGTLAAISGSVNTPAIYELRGRSRLADLLELAGGLNVTASGQKVSVERIVDRKTRKVEDFQLDKAGLERLLQDGDFVKVAPLSPRFDNAVTLRGNVAAPSRFPWRSGMRVRDVIPDRGALIVADYWLKRNQAVRPDTAARDRDDARQRESGAVPGVGTERLRTDVRRSLPEVNWDYAAIERLNVADLTTMLIPFNLGKAVLEGDPTQNLLLQPGDVITIFAKDDIQVQVAKQPVFVRLEGEVAVAGVYQVAPGETLRQLVTRIGGLSPNAYLYGAEFERESTRQLQQKRLEEAADRMEQDIQRNLSNRSTLSKEDAETAKTAAEGQAALVARLRKARATGRIVLEIPPRQAQLRNLPDLRLEDGDRFFVPARPSTVSVIGAVYNSSSFIFREQKRFNDYLAQSGGPTKDADTSSLYVLRADGSVVSKRQSGILLSRLEREVIQPGDTIVVPENLDKYRLTKDIKDWSQILYQFGLAAAGIKVLKD